MHCDSTWVPHRLFQGRFAAFLIMNRAAETAGYNHYRSAARLKLSPLEA
jgi:hypothetical protein